MPIVPLIMGAVSLAGGIAQGVSANNAKNDYASMLEDTEMGIPNSILQAEQRVRNYTKAISNEGLAGYERMVGQVDTGIGEATQVGKQMVDNPTDLLNMLTEVYSQGEKQKTNLAVMDEQQQTANRRESQEKMTSFLSNVKAPAEERIEDFDVQKALAAERERMSGRQDLFSGITSGIGGGLSAFGSGMQMQSQMGVNDAMMDYFGTKSGGAGGSYEEQISRSLGLGVDNNINPSAYNTFFG